METVTCWEVGFGRFNWVAVKNVVIIGLFAIVFGSLSSIKDIIAEFFPTE